MRHGSLSGGGADVVVLACNIDGAVHAGFEFVPGGKASMLYDIDIHLDGRTSGDVLGSRVLDLCCGDHIFDTQKRNNMIWCRRLGIGSFVVHL
ncbi:hypothetical protein IF1G_02577 [Cordyceps javanica]|uniref:Uncharacterized protein n=1 Tax=Cordyceps javanica TaxID=43265 RepID=A0A545V9U9_9HYPO|nr:hypothetical protein IF1G_02577 [Cordyceps javanica]